MGSVQAILLAILSLLQLASSAVPPTRIHSKALNKHEKLIVISFDGFRNDYLDKANAPTLKALLNSGVTTSQMNAAFMTKTFVNHQSFVTGMYSESHGVTDNGVFDPVYNEYMDGFGDYNDKFWNFSNETVPIWTLNEWAGDGRISAVQFPGANQHYGANRTLPTHFLPYVHNRPYDERMDIVYSWLTNDTHPANLVFMYFDEPDSAGHAYGPDSDEVQANITRLDGLTKYLLDRLEVAGILDQINFIFWSDHGMQEVMVQNRINLTELMLPVPASAFSRYGSSPVHHIQPNPGQEDVVYNALKNASVGRNFSVYSRAEIPEKWHYQNNRRIMDIIVVADAGFVFQDYKATEPNATRKYGVHGYDNNDETMKPFFIANGPLFKKNFNTGSFDSIDLFPLIASVMGFGPPNHNGTFGRVSGMLINQNPTTVPTFGTTDSSNARQIASSTSLIELALLLGLLQTTKFLLNSK